MEPMKVYYYAFTTDGKTIMILTDAEYFNTYDCFDGDGDSEHYEEIGEAMLDLDADLYFGGHFDSACAFQLSSDSTIESIVDAMKDKGFELVNEPDFVKFCTETNVIYYCTKDDEGELRFVVTSKAYCNRAQCVDDGTSLLSMIDSSLKECGAWDVCEAEYTLDDGVTLEQVIDKMSKIGFTMIADPDFAEFLEEWVNEEY